MPFSKKPITPTFLLLAASSYFGGAAYIGGVRGLMEYAASNRKNLSYSEGIQIGAKIVAYGAAKSFTYTAYPLFRLFNKPSTYQRTTKEFAKDTVANATLNKK